MMKVFSWLAVIAILYIIYIIIYIKYYILLYNVYYNLTQKAQKSRSVKAYTSMIIVRIFCMNLEEKKERRKEKGKID